MPFPGTVYTDDAGRRNLGITGMLGQIRRDEDSERVRDWRGPHLGPIPWPRSERERVWLHMFMEPGKVECNLLCFVLLDLRVKLTNNKRPVYRLQSCFNLEVPPSRYYLRSCVL